MTYEQKAAEDLVNWFLINCSRVNPSLPVEQRREFLLPADPAAPMPPQTGPLARLLEGPFCGK